MGLLGSVGYLICVGVSPPIPDTTCSADCESAGSGIISCSGEQHAGLKGFEANDSGVEEIWLFVLTTSVAIIPFHITMVIIITTTTTTMLGPRKFGILRHEMVLEGVGLENPEACHST